MAIFDRPSLRDAEFARHDRRSCGSSLGRRTSRSLGFRGHATADRLADLSPQTIDSRRVPGSRVGWSAVTSPAVPDPLSGINVPGALLHAIAQRTGRVTLIVGAGCSLEAPTSLRLSSFYSKAVFDDLVADCEMDAGECADPYDLSALASAVHEKFGDQSRVVQRLPRNDFLYAKANDGYLIAAALLAEGSVSCVATLNYDLALTDAVKQLDARDVNQIAGPSHLADFGSSAIVYLHRNVNEQDFTKWILRKEALESEWQDDWEGVVAARLAASPVVVFAGLGSPAAVLTETIARVRSLVPNALLTFLADPSETSAFADALNLDDVNHVRARWNEFMQRLGARLALEFSRELRVACDEMIAANGWADSRGTVETLCDAYEAAGILGIGRIRASWLGTGRVYEPDTPAHRELLADLLLGIGLLRGADGASVRLRTDGAVEIAKPGASGRLVLPVSGRGTRRWSQLDPLVAAMVEQLERPPELVLAAGFQGPRPGDLAPPEDIVATDSSEDVAIGALPPRVFAIEDLRDDPDLVQELAS